jgi:RNA polymerase subunit RPABC4/transcription elongation factor Spt4
LDARLLIGWPGGSLESTLKLGAALLVAYVIVLWMSAVIWVYRDVRSRTSDPLSQTIAVLLVAVFNLPGLMVYLVIRPQETLADAYERSLEAESILHELQADAAGCQTCRRPVEPDFKVCPYCKTVLREACKNCGRAVRTNWVACPYCATERIPVPRPALRQPAAGRQAPAAVATNPRPLQPPQRPGPHRPADGNAPPAERRPPVPS